ncbi:MAG: tRNA (adenosine(37)-N6)-threonylcarbamoyltransferase complex transferase subunit TsaD [Mycoplasmoidaceae bacterium]
MKKYIIGIETSCDDTSIALLENEKVIQCITVSSEKELSKHGGIVPEIASREHARKIINVFHELIFQTKINYEEITMVAYTAKPGLITSLHVGKIFALTLAWYLNVDVLEIDHIDAHIFSPFINKKEIRYPFLSLIVSGGTTALYKVENSTKISVINKTLDDALGEAYDKVGRYLNLSYPGGPAIDLIFDDQKINYKYKLPRPQDPFSYSGMKSKIKNIIDKNSNDLDVVGIASSFQYWAITSLIEKINFYSKKYQINKITIGGGVSANQYFRREIKKSSISYLFPEQEYSCDNAAMIGYLAYVKSSE